MKILRPLALACFALLAFGSLAAAAPVTYSINKPHTEVGFDVRHIFSRVHGRFTDFAGTIVFDEQNPAAISVDATADARTIWTDNDFRDKDLRTSKFFAVDSFPTLSFKSTKVTATAKNKYKVAGNLTLRGVTKPVVFEAEFLGAGAFGMDGKAMGAKAGFAATTVINRKDFGINWNKVLDNGSMLLSDDVTLTLNIEADQVQAATK